MKNIHRYRVLWLAALLVAVGSIAAPPAAGDSALGDWGHFLSYEPEIHMHNPDGQAFEFTVHVMQWGSARWNKQHIELKLTDPEGKVLAEGKQKLTKGAWSMKVPAGAGGTYKLEPKGNLWVSSTLDRMVVSTGKIGGHMVDDRRVVFQASVPRRWWFFVPDDVERFTVRAQRADRYMSQREDWAFFVISPRGQRINALVGQPSNAPEQYRQEMVAEVEVEPGSGGRFWAIDVAFGDSHNYSNINLGFDGVPGYLAGSPEEWFNPATGKRADVTIYEPLPFIQATIQDKQIAAKIRDRWPRLKHWSPSPSLGDPDGVQVLGNARFMLWNPEGRDLAFRIGTYIPRNWGDDAPQGHVKVTGPAGKIVLDEDVAIQHIHGGAHGKPNYTLEMDKGMATVHVTDVERWFAFTYPATPLVLVGKLTQAQPQRYTFNLTVGIARNWYFYVPEGTRQFTVAAACEAQTDMIDLEINAPDRTMARIYGNRGEQTVDVPEGEDGKIWHVRPSIGSGTRIITTDPEGGRYQEINLKLSLHGVPGLLAPTWEQWFDPEDPKMPHQRGQ